MITVHMVGLMYFLNEGNGERRVLLPNGTGANNAAPPHHASFWVEADDLESDDWWANSKFDKSFDLRVSLTRTRPARVFEFRIPSKATVTIAGSDQAGGPLVTTNLDTALPKLHAMDPALIINANDADTIAQMPLRSGTIGVFGYGGAGAVQLDLEPQGALEVTVRLDTNGQETRKFTLKPADGTAREVVFSNTYDLLNGVSHGGNGHGNGHGNHLDHFKLYGKLDLHRRDQNLMVPPPMNLPQLPHDHDFLRRIAQVVEVPGTGCVPSCC